MEGYTVKTRYSEAPYDFMNGWEWLSDAAPSSEYSELDMMFEVLNAYYSDRQILEEKIKSYNDAYNRNLTFDEIFEEYKKRYPIMVGRSLIDIGKQILDGTLKLEVTL